MGTFVSVVDFIFLLLLFLYVSSVVWKGFGSVLLATAIAMAAAVFVVVSFTAASGPVKSTSFLTHAPAPGLCRAGGHDARHLDSQTS